MNTILPNGNILAFKSIGDDTLMACGTREVPPSDPSYEACTIFMSEEDEVKALAVLAEYRKTLNT